MQLQKMIGRFIVISSASVLAACGGSSSGGGESSGASLSLDSENLAGKKIEISSAMSVDGINQLTADLYDAFILVSDLYGSIWSQFGGESGAKDCDGGGRVTVNYAGEGWNDNETWDFNDCVISTYSHGSVLLNGTFRYVDNLTRETATTENWQGYESYNITGEMKDTGEALVIKGRLDWDELYAWDNEAESGRIFETIDAFELKVGDRYVALTNSETRLEGTEFGATYSVAGKLIGSAVGGYVQLSTPTALQIPDYESCPSEGIIKVSSNGTAEVRYGSSAAGTASAVAIWIDGQIIESYDDCTSVVFTPIL